MKKISLKAYIPYLAAIAIFIAISIGYFLPEIFQNKALYQHDIVTGAGIGNEAGEFTKRTGERTFWTNALFGGMPTYQIAPGGSSSKILSYIQRLSSLYFLPSPANLVFLYLIGAFLLFLALRVNPWLAILGAIAYTFSSYFFVIIQAGHIWKVLVLAYIPPTFAGIIWTYRGKYLAGAALTAVYMALQLVSNHPQMTYYFGLVVLIYVIGMFIHSCKNKQIPGFIKASLSLVVAVCIAFALNLTNLYHTMDYSKYSIRGGSELTDNKEDKTDGGLDRSYVTGWSYGVGETFTLLIPNAKGGASGIFGADRETTNKVVSMVQNNVQIPNQAKNDVAQHILYTNTYWADQPGTSGPVYVGAFIMFLFILGIFIVRGWFKWVLLIATILSIMLSWGSNFMWLTNLFLDNFPYYNKLRAVSSMLIIAELCIPVLAILALKTIIENPEIIKIKQKQFYIALASTAGLVLLFILLPGTFFTFLSQQEAKSYGEMLNNPQASQIYRPIVDIIESVRISVFRADALRSLLIICLGVALLLLFCTGKIKVKAFIVTVTVLVLFDMWQVDKRYLSSKDFKPQKTSFASLMPKTPVDEEILKDQSLNYRVYNLTVSPFNDGSTSFYHKSVGGYHGAKLRRYQDIIERYLGAVNSQNVQSLLNTDRFNVFNMLNTKYIIVPGQNNSPQLLRNPNAFGNAWFVDDIKWVNNADEEIAALANTNPAKIAIIDNRFKTADLHNLKTNKPTETDSTGINNSYIKLVEYAPNKLVYESNTDVPKLAVLSEVYYPKGWYASIDGQEAGILRANYILRAIMVPAGKHTVELRFAPKTYHITERIAWIAYIFLFGFIALAVVRKKKF
ncbi:MAG: hypothetical protein LBR10_05075 [Prevotellaceae bacterium]|jgi:hypothetical protein|nr:hypothetical protein [Prevotellaceae bacterium]